MADDAAAPDGELTETAKEVQPADKDAVERVDTAEDDAEDDAGADEDDDAEDDAGADEDDAPAKPPMSHVSLALIAGLVGVLALAGLVGWLGYRTYESHRAEEQRNVFLQVGRQGALNLTTIGWETADADVQRILDSATGSFYDEFQQRAEPFVQVVKQAQSKSVGTIAEAGIESASDNEAQVLVAVTVQTTNAGAPEQQPRAWRMRISVQDIDGDAKVSNVEFVP
ncbi:Mce protein [Mycolicibacterium sp. BiH015]|uniref:Mce protein n=1 Tax=Mycolicibacterium sp. BiH015 TaxID=3018808 RepID=UPI0022E4432C|nr:Mce protein [Mycolicibacterium sp. BiH015]MDA2892758.1 Mce protein [Mycolicibacterium sp. BiH015]